MPAARSEDTTPAFQAAILASADAAMTAHIGCGFLPFRFSLVPWDSSVWMSIDGFPLC
jgi:hypothetical protein